MNPSRKSGNCCKLLLVGGKNNSLDALSKDLADSGFITESMADYSDAIDFSLLFTPEVILIDSSGNELSAMELCISMKSLGRLKNAVVIILSDRKDEAIEISALNAGADDFLLLPLKLNVLLERIKTRLKKPDHAITITPDHENALPLKIDRESYSVSVGNHFVQLARKEFELLYLMASNPDKMFEREELFRLIWNKENIGKNRTLDVHIARLRQKIGEGYISSQKGIGYRFKSN